MTNSSSLESIDRSLRELVELARLEQQNFTALREVTQQQAQTASLQAENIRSLVSAVADRALVNYRTFTRSPLPHGNCPTRSPNE